MSLLKIHHLHPTRFGIALLFLSASGLMLAQDQLPVPQPPSGGWRRVGDPAPAPPASQRPPVAQSQSQQDPTEPVDRSDAYGQPGQVQDPLQDPQQGPPVQQQGPPPADPQMNRRSLSRPPGYGLPPNVTVKPGTFVTIRTNQPLSSDHNQQGDTFSATLAAPLVVDGIVVAQRGETVYGRVADVQKQHSGSSSHLGLELTSLTLADGTQVPVRTQLVARQGSSTPGEVQAGTIVGTTAVGAAIGAAADWGRGAAIGAGAGAAAGIIGVLLTRNHATVVYPETALTFRVESPVTVDLARAPQAFRYVGPEEYNHPVESRMGPGPGPRPVGPVAPLPYAYGPAYYPYPYYYGPSFYLGWGPGYFYGRGYYRRWR